MPKFKIGIGLGCSKDLVIKAGKKGTGINDLIWIGDAVIDACKLSSQGNIDSFEPIVMSDCFYTNIKDGKANSKETYSDCCSQKYSNKRQGNPQWYFGSNQFIRLKGRDTDFRNRNSIRVVFDFIEQFQRV